MSEIDIVAANNALTPEPQRPEAIEEEDEDQLEAEGTRRQPEDSAEAEQQQQEKDKEAADEQGVDDGAESDDSELELRPLAISEQLKVGKHSGDRATNTDATEVAPLQQLTASLAQLQAQAAELKREFLLTRGCMRAEFEQQVAGKSLELHAHINEQTSLLEKTHAKQLDRARKAHEAELNEAVIKVHRMYDSGFKLRQAEQRPAPDASQQQAEIRRLKNKLLIAEAEAQRLEEEVQRLNEELAKADEALAAASLEPPPPPPPVVVERRPSGPVYKQSDIDDLERKIKKLEQAMEERDERIQQLTEEAQAAAAASAAAAEQQQLLQQSLDERSEANSQLLEQLQAMRQRADASESEMREQLQQELEEAVRKSRESALAEAAVEAAAAAEEAATRQSRLQAALADAEATLAEERRLNRERLEQLKDAERLRSSEEELRRQVARLRAELKKLDLVWEKKFAVLKRSLHAVKDESFLRQTAQRQAAVLHQASVMYAADAPAAAQLPPTAEQQQQQQQQQQQLMVTGNNSRRKKGFHEQRADLLSYTASAPVSAGQRTATGFHSDDENQICSEGEELPQGARPLPDRPELRQ